MPATELTLLPSTSRDAKSCGSAALDGASPSVLLNGVPDAATVLAATRDISARQLAPLVVDIDKGLYPREVLTELGRAGAFALHMGACLPGKRSSDAAAGLDLGPTIETMSIISEYCLSTGFMAWCQNTLGWYVANTDNAAARERFGAAVASGRVLGGTGLSNPMKSFFGIESVKLKGKRVEGGYSVRGILPWVSNLGEDHLFGAIFEREDAPGTTVMFLADCADPRITLKPCEPFLSMDGTGTYGVQFRDVFVPDELVLADPCEAFIHRIRAGFVLLQAGMAVGVVRDCIAMMREVSGQLGHINRYLEIQPDEVEAHLAELEAEVNRLAATPYETDLDYWRRVIAVRLAGGEASVTAAHAAMLHCGARGYVAASRCQRRLREAYFVAIVTPATKQLRKMLADLAP